MWKSFYQIVTYEIEIDVLAIRIFHNLAQALRSTVGKGGGYDVHRHSTVAVVVEQRSEHYTAIWHITLIDVANYIHR